MQLGYGSCSYRPDAGKLTVGRAGMRRLPDHRACSGDPLVRMLIDERILFLTVGRIWRMPITTPDRHRHDATYRHAAPFGSALCVTVTGTDRKSRNIDAENAYRAWAADRGQEPLVVHQPETARIRGPRGSPRIIACRKPSRCRTASPAGTRPGCCAPSPNAATPSPEASGSSRVGSEHSRSTTPLIVGRPGRNYLPASRSLMLVNRLESPDRPIPSGDLHGRLIVRGSTA